MLLGGHVKEETGCQVVGFSQVHTRAHSVTFVKIQTSVQHFDSCGTKEKIQLTMFLIHARQYVKRSGPPLYCNSLGIYVILEVVRCNLRSMFDVAACCSPSNRKKFIVNPDQVPMRAHVMTKKEDLMTTILPGARIVLLQVVRCNLKAACLTLHLAVHSSATGEGTGSLFLPPWGGCLYVPSKTGEPLSGLLLLLLYNAKIYHMVLPNF